MSRRGRAPAREREGGRLVLLLLAGLLLLLGAGYVAAYLTAGDKVARGTTVAGVDVGGRTQAAAARALETGLAGRLGARLEIYIDGQRYEGTGDITPAAAGLSVDYVASVAEAGGRESWEPSRLWTYFTGGDDLDAVLSVDDAKLTALLAGLGDSSGRRPVDGAIAFENGRAVVTRPRPGTEIDPDRARESLVGAWLAQRDTLDLVLRDTAPAIDSADVQEALNTFANPALSGPVTLVFGKSPVRLQPRDFLRVLRLRAENGSLVPDLRVGRLTRLVDSATSGRGAPKDASVEIVDGKPKVVPAKPGVSYRPRDVADTFLEVVTRTDKRRRAKVHATVEEPEFTTKDARSLKIKERVSTFTTNYPYAEYRNVNIGRAAEIIDGTVLAPGDTFSLNGIVGERTRENGFTEGFIISNGIFEQDLGGGVSQLATTTFNAAYFAGLEDVEHKAHSLYIDRYPVGREATVAFGSVDLRFKNDTPHGVLVDAHVTPATSSSQGVVTVSMYSKKYWDITSSTGDRYNPTSPGTRTLRTPDCYPNTGYGGFDIDVVRYFRKHGKDALDHQERLHTRYRPSDTVICKKPNG